MFLFVENRLNTKNYREIFSFCRILEKLIAELFAGINWIVFAPLTFSVGSPEACYVQSSLLLISD